MTDERFDYLAADVAYTREKVDEINSKLSAHGERLATLEVKSGLWGMLGGVVAYVAFKLKGGA